MKKEGWVLRGEKAEEGPYNRGVKVKNGGAWGDADGAMKLTPGRLV